MGKQRIENRLPSLPGHITSRENRAVLETVVRKAVVSHGVRVISERFIIHHVVFVVLFLLIVNEEETELHEMRWMSNSETCTLGNDPQFSSGRLL
jgi:hypothetical protein